MKLYVHDIPFVPHCPPAYWQADMENPAFVAYVPSTMAFQIYSILQYVDWAQGISLFSTVAMKYLPMKILFFMAKSSCLVKSPWWKQSNKLRYCKIKLANKKLDILVNMC